MDARMQWVADRTVLLNVDDAVVDRCFASQATLQQVQEWFEQDGVDALGNAQPALFISSIPSVGDAESDSAAAKRRASDIDRIVVTIGAKHPRALGALFFVKSEPCAILSGMTGDEVSMLVDYGTLGENELEDLKLLLDEVYMPVFGAGSGEPTKSFATKSRDPTSPTATAPALPAATAGLGEDDLGLSDRDSKMLASFAGAMTTLSSNIDHVMDKVYMGHHIKIPDLVHPCLSDPTLIAGPDSIPYAITVQLEIELGKWTTVISSTVEAEAIKLAQAPSAIKSPIDEIAFWRRRLVALSTLCEQIRMPDVQRLLDVMSRVHLQQLTVFRDHAAELDRVYAEAKDNTKFLTTLERHFKVLESTDFALIIDTMPSMMNAIRMVWIISRHYNTDERMVPLLVRIANKLCEQAAKQLSITHLVDMRSGDAEKLCGGAKEMLLSWSKNYNKTQDKIDHSSSEHRWQFDKKRLFDRSKYIVRVVDDLSDMISILNHFRMFLGPRLKSVTGDPGSIDALVTILDETILPLRTVEFDIFASKNFAEWETLVDAFRIGIKLVETKTTDFLDAAFRELRSSEGAFDMLCAMGITSDMPPPPPDQDGLGTNAATIANQMVSKFDDILRQYGKELEHAERTFDSQRDHPPIYRNFPPVAGAVAWAAEIFQRVKQPIVRFRAMTGLLESPIGDAIKTQYLTLVRRLDAYICELYHTWCAKSVPAGAELLKQPILGPIPAGGIHGPGDVPPPPFTVNFSPAMSTLIREAVHLDKLGLRIPYAAQNLALQHETYTELQRQLVQVMHQHQMLIKSLTPIESEALASYLQVLEKKLSEGCWPLNWTSLHIRSFIDHSNTELRVFRSVLQNVRKSSSMIEEIIADIDSAELISASMFEDRLAACAAYPPAVAVCGPSSIEQQRSVPGSADAHTLKTEAAAYGIGEFVYIIETRRAEVHAAMAKRYRAIRDPLHKVEQIVAETDTGMSPLLAGYYAHWERRVFQAITRMVLTGLNTLYELLQSPIVHVWGSLADGGPSIAMQPPVADLQKMLRKVAMHLLDTGHAFPRWMRGTCHPCAPMPQGDNMPPLTLSFYEEVCRSPVIIRAVQKLQKSVAATCSNVKSHVQVWSLYNEKHSLWAKRGKRSMEEQREILLRQTPSTTWFQEKIAFYERLARAVRSEASEQGIGFVRFDASRLAADLESQIMMWRAGYGDVVYTLAHDEFTQLSELIDDYKIQLSIHPEDLPDLKKVLKSVSVLLAKKLEMELKIFQLRAKYDVLQHYNLMPAASPEGLTDEWEQVQALNSVWQKLIIAAKTKDMRLERIKEHFKGDTEKQTEVFKQKCAEVLEACTSTGPTRPNGDLAAGLKSFRHFTQLRADMVAEKDKITEVRKLFGLEVTQMVDLVKLGDDLIKVSAIYDTFGAHMDFVGRMSNMLWDSLDENVLKKGAISSQTDWRKLPKSVKNIKEPYDLLGAEIQAFIDSIPLIESLKNEAMQTRHWNQLMDVTKVKFVFSDTFTLESIFKMNLARFEDDINGIVGVAMQEMKIERELNKIIDMWSGTNFQHTLYQRELGKVMAGPKIFSLTKPGEGGTDELRLELDDHLLKLSAMASKQAALNFADKIKHWMHSLDLMITCIDEWIKVQQNWVLMDKIFGASEDIRMQLPEEARLFDAINQAWIKMMQGMHDEPNVKIQCEVDGRLAVLESIMERLENCQKSLTNYLNTKRAAFPRFYFKSEAALLSILGDANPLNIQEHLSSMFMACKKFKFVQGSSYIAGMVSPKKEKYAYRKHVSTEGAVETWLTNAEDEMKATLRLIAKGGVFAYAGADRMEWLDDQLCMVAILASQIWWTWEVEDVFKLVQQGDKYAMKTLLDRWSSHLDGLIDYVRKPDATKMMKRKIMQLMIIEVHSRDLVGVFVRDSVLTETDFKWESQLRMYWDQEIDDVAIKQCTGVFEYGYEYTGLLNRLVITPLTDRCYMTITQALTFRLGCSPAGPAGTGKTETTKDLAKGLGVPCYVTCCGEGLDYYQMGQIFSGLCQIGAWGCFDEFNRINIEVLSVVSAQIKSIQDALNAGATQVDLRGTSEVGLDDKVGIFITMNPGYAGRNELPDNLKALFRPVMMIVPDSEKICLIMLMAQGFKQAKVLSRKMTVLYKLASEQLSKQYHYDFALRALISVLLNAGGALGAEIKANPDVDPAENLVMMRALRDTNKPKFVFEDVPLFRNLIIDLFPGLECPRIAFMKLQVAVDNWFTENNYRHSDNEGDESAYMKQVDKTIQTFETIDTRWSTMIVGPTGGGKTTVMKCLQHAMKGAFGYTVKQFVLNPKAQSTTLLYGEMDNETGEWTNGILANTFRMVNQTLTEATKMRKHWIVYDGDVDAVWIEDMNSVMDDNKCLTLSNGERIQLKEHSVMLFETFDLQYASPATISRCGMVWVDPKDLRYRPFFERWCVMRPYNAEREVEREILNACFERYVPKTLELIVDGFINGAFVGRLNQIIPVTELSMVRQLTALLDALIPATQGEVALTTEEIEGVFVYACVWSLGGALTMESRLKLSEFIDSVSQARLPPSDKSLFSYMYDMNTHSWETWESLVADYVPPTPFEFAKVLVPTKDNVTYLKMLDLLARDCYTRPTMFVGMPGCAKSVTVQNFMDQHLDQEVFNTLSMNFSSRTSAVDVRGNFRTAVDKRTGRTYGPKGGKKLNLFVDDLNMPEVDLYGTQQPVTALLFLISHNKMFDCEEDSELVRLYEDVFCTAAMGPPGGARNPVDPRFIALFNVFCLPEPSESVCKTIYSAISKNFMSSKFAGNEPLSLLGDKLADMTLNLYHFIIEHLPPTPAKFHYIFNLRDLGRVFEGILLATPDHFAEPQDFVRIWRNEVTRTFGDRLINDADNGLVAGEIANIISQYTPNEAKYALADPLVFGDWEFAVQRVVDYEEDPRLYHDLSHLGPKPTRKLFDSILEELNVRPELKSMNLVLFPMAIEHITRILRIISRPLGNALLVGLGGSGKQSLSRLSSFCAGYEVFVITLARTYGVVQFKDDLKTLYKKLALGPCTFLFTDAHIAQEGFLEIINNILTTGIVPALYDADEKDAIIGQIREAAGKAGVVPTFENLWRYYISQCRANLHVVLAMTPSGDDLRRRCRNFPGMISATVIDWFFAWPQDALYAVAENFLRETPIPEDHRESIYQHIVKVHSDTERATEQYMEELRRFYVVTPKNFLDYIENYKEQLAEKDKGVEDDISRLEGGLSKLITAADDVAKLTVKVQAQKVIVDAQTIECNAVKVDIETKTVVANKQKADAETKAAALAVAAEEIAVQSAEATVALESAMPILEAAQEALDGLSKDQITNLKGMGSPLPMIESVGVCLVHLQPYPKEAKKFAIGWKGGGQTLLGKMDILPTLTNYDLDSLNDKKIRNVKKEINRHAGEMTVERVRGMSAPAGGLFDWVWNLVAYYAVAKEVKPLQLKVKKMEQEQMQSEKALAIITAKLAKLMEDLAELDATFTKLNGELTVLAEQAADMEKKLNAASKLIKGLGGERTRWTQQVVDLKKSRPQLVGDCLLASSFLSYLGAFTFDYRMRLLEEGWVTDLAERDVPHSSDFSVRALLVSDSTVQGWVGEGLPADDNSVQNGILATKSSRFPLCIDPQEQALRWIINRERPHGLKISTFSSGDFMKYLELSVNMGFPFLFQNVSEAIDPVVDPILEKNTFIVSQQKMIKLGDTDVSWDDNFRLYLTTKLANPHYSPEIMGKTMVINFAVTLDGLRDQLLNDVVANERPDLDVQWNELVTATAANTKMLLELEDDLLQRLANSTGNLLEDDELIAALEQTKTRSTEIAEQLSQAAFTKSEIQTTRVGYTPAAKRGAIVFFCMQSLSKIRKMYEFALASFRTVFKRSLKQATRSVVLESRIDNIINELTRQSYDFTCTGIFEAHKLLFSFQLTIAIMTGENELNRAELDIFLKGDTALDDPKRRCPCSWLSKSNWKDIIKVEELGGGFAGLADSVAESEVEWRAWYDLGIPEANPFPCGFSEKLDIFQQLLVFRCFRPDRAFNAVKNFVAAKMGEKYVRPPNLEFQRVFDQSTPLNPIVFILSPGADPQSGIDALGKKLDFTTQNNRYKFLALGSGQGPKAESLLKTGKQRGHWVLLQNSHLLLSWLGYVEGFLEDCASNAPHEDFRLWMTTDPTDSFPLGILQLAYKVVTEPPDGLMLNMSNAYAQLEESGGQEMIDECPHEVFAPVLFVLCFLHAVVLERRKYGKIGWNVPYDFNDSDFNVSRRLLKMCVLFLLLFRLPFLAIARHLPPSTHTHAHTHTHTHTTHISLYHHQVFGQGDCEWRRGHPVGLAEVFDVRRDVRRPRERRL